MSWLVRQMKDCGGSIWGKQPALNYLPAATNVVNLREIGSFWVRSVTTAE
jgi:hypothetical protein